MRGYLKGILALVSLGSLVSGGWLMAQNAPVKNVVLVHGAFADGSSWSKVIPLLQAKGLHVTSVGTPLTSFADDLAATKRAIAAEDGPVILVGHSYGGVVITEAGNDPKVAGLVYVAAFAPDANQNITEISKPFRPRAQQSETANRWVHPFDSRRHRDSVRAGPDQGGESAPCCGPASNRRCNL